jgi:hypothetical protein
MRYEKFKIKYSKIGHKVSKKIENFLTKFYVNMLNIKENTEKKSRKIIKDLGYLIKEDNVNTDKYRRNPGYWK